MLKNQPNPGGYSWQATMIICPYVARRITTSIGLQTTVTKSQRWYCRIRHSPVFLLTEFQGARSTFDHLANHGINHLRVQSTFANGNLPILWMSSFGLLHVHLKKQQISYLSIATEIRRVSTCAHWLKMAQLLPKQKYWAHTLHYSDK